MNSCSFFFSGKIGFQRSKLFSSPHPAFRVLLALPADNTQIEGSGGSSGLIFNAV
jgi:hypothetical protein